MGSKFVTEIQLPLVSKTLVTSTSVRFDRFTNNFRNIKLQSNILCQYINKIRYRNTYSVYNNSNSDFEIFVLAKKSNWNIEFVVRAIS